MAKTENKDIALATLLARARDFGKTSRDSAAAELVQDLSDAFANQLQLSGHMATSYALDMEHYRGILTRIVGAANESDPAEAANQAIGIAAEALRSMRHPGEDAKVQP